MDLDALEEALLAIAAKVNLPVRYEPFDAKLAAFLHARAGMVRVSDTTFLLVDVSLSPIERVTHIARVLRQHDLDWIDVKQEVRQFIDRAGATPRQPPAASYLQIKR